MLLVGPYYIRLSSSLPRPIALWRQCYSAARQGMYEERTHPQNRVPNEIHHLWTGIDDSNLSMTPPPMWGDLL